MVVAIMTRLRAGRSGIRIPVRERDFLYSKCLNLLRDSSSLLLNLHRNCLSGVKRPERDVNHSPPSGVEVKNGWSYTSTPLGAFMAWKAKALPLIYIDGFHDCHTK